METLSMSRNEIDQITVFEDLRKKVIKHERLNLIMKSKNREILLLFIGIIV